MSFLLKKLTDSLSFVGLFPRYQSYLMMRYYAFIIIHGEFSFNDCFQDDRTSSMRKVPITLEGCCWYAGHMLSTPVDASGSM